MQRSSLDSAPGTCVLWGRAVVLAGVALGVGALSHVAGGGQLPHPVALLLLAVVSVPAAALFLSSRASTARVVALVVAGQGATHMALSVLGGHRDTVRAAGPTATTPVLVPPADGSRSGSLFEHYTATYGAAPGPAAPSGSPFSWLGHQADHLAAQGPAMVLAHLAGAVVVGVLLAVGETSLWRLLLLLVALGHVTRAGWRLLVAAAGVRSGVAVARARVRPVVPQLSTSQVLDRQAVRRRGPPVLLAA